MNRKGIAGLLALLTLTALLLAALPWETRQLVRARMENASVVTATPVPTDDSLFGDDAGY